MKKLIRYGLLISVLVFMNFIDSTAIAGPIHDAAADDNVEEMIRLIADKTDLNSLAPMSQDYDAMPIHFAARNGSLEAIKLLLKNGVDVDVKLPRDEMTPLCIAAIFCQLDAVRLLIEKGANVNAKFKGGGTAIGLAAQYSKQYGLLSFQIVKLLLEKGADPLIRPNNDWTALHGAAIAGETRIVELLIDHGADVNLVSKGEFGTPPIYRAAMVGHIEVIKVLLDNGAKVNLQDNAGRTALLATAVEGHTNVAKFLLDNGADPSIRDNRGNTAEMHAASRNHTDIVDLIADFKASNRNKDTGDSIAYSTTPQELKWDSLEIPGKPTFTPSALAISPDGSKLVYAAEEGGISSLWLHFLDTGKAVKIPATENAAAPFWSPDSRFIAFFSDGQLKKFNIDSGRIYVILVWPSVVGGTWNEDDLILFSAAAGNILSISSTGGQRRPVTRVTPGQVSHRYPYFLPDGRHFLYYVTGEACVYLGSLGSGKVERLVESHSGAFYIPSGHLIYVRGSRLYAHGFDFRQMKMIGKEIQMADGDISLTVDGRAGLSVSRRGDVVYRSRSEGVGQWQLVWFDRSGQELKRLGEPLSNIGGPELSPDGNYVAISTGTKEEGIDIYLMDTEKGALKRITRNPAIDGSPVWSPDGNRIVFSSLGRGNFEISADGIGDSRPFLGTIPGMIGPSVLDWSNDGQSLLLHALGFSGVRSGGSDIFGIDLTGDRNPYPLLQTMARETGGQFSPDGKWIAYQSDISGQFEIYIQPLKNQKTGKEKPSNNPFRKSAYAVIEPIGPVSANGGVQARWNPDGSELFYISLDQRLMSVPVNFPSGNEQMEVGKPVPLFDVSVGEVVLPVYAHPNYAVAPDGKRFLLNTTKRETSPITLLSTSKDQVK